jgi:HK97 family phage major capsid protein
LTTATRFDAVASYDSLDVVPALGLAYGEIESDMAITLVANRRTWANLATSLDGENRPIFTVVGNQVAAGALGTFNVVLSNVLDDGDVVIGAFADYNLVTRGGLGTLLSREATVGELNLFTQDATALRADIDITGKPVFNTSFYLLQFPVAS